MAGLSKNKAIKAQLEHEHGLGLATPELRRIYVIYGLSVCICLAAQRTNKVTSTFLCTMKVLVLTLFVRGMMRVVGNLD